MYIYMLLEWRGCEKWQCQLFHSTHSPSIANFLVDTDFTNGMNDLLIADAIVEPFGVIVTFKTAILLASSC